MKRKLKYLSFKIRSFLIKILLSLTHKLGKMESVIASDVRVLDLINCIEGKENHDYQSAYIYYETKKIKIKDMLYLHRDIPMKELLKSPDDHFTTCDCPDCVYPWEELIENIKKNGILKNPTLLKKTNMQFPYLVRDGNHRIRAFEHLYGRDVSITVNIYITRRIYKHLAVTYDYKLEMQRKRLEELKKKLTE